jgi:HPt (histidine-containing phosphotransfer) domain-containing protein
VRKIEAGESRPRTPIIAWTANALAEEEGRCQAAGMDELLVKPANLAQLKSVLAKWLAIAVSGGEAAAPSGPDGVSGAQLIDYSVLNNIVPDSAGHERILNEFLVHIRGDLAQLAEALGQGNLADAESMAHRMKGSSRMVGATVLAKSCEALEQAARNRDREASVAAKESIDQALDRLESFISAGRTGEGE